MVVVIAIETLKILRHEKQSCLEDYYFVDYDYIKSWYWCDQSPIRIYQWQKRPPRPEFYVSLELVKETLFRSRDQVWKLYASYFSSLDPEEPENFNKLQLVFHIELKTDSRA